jgi:hypothetical protein
LEGYPDPRRNAQQKVLESYIKTAIKHDLPVAMLIYSNPDLNAKLPTFGVQNLSWHWMTITAINMNKDRKSFVTISTWGDKTVISLDDIMKGASDFIYFDCA